MQLKGLQLRNFQKWLSLDLEFHPGVNYFVGETDAGKSAVRRAIVHCMQNKGGKTYVSHTMKESSVKCITADDGSVTRLAGKANEYILERDGVETESYKAFRTDVPIQIANIFSVGNINIQAQFDAPFLMTLTKGKLADAFNKLLKLDIIPNTLNALNAKKRAYQARVDGADIEIMEKNDKLLIYAGLDDAEKDLTVLINADNDIQTREVRLENVVQIINLYNTTLSTLPDSKIVTDLYCRLDEIGLEQNYIVERQTHFNLVATGVNNLIDISKELKQLKAVDIDVMASNIDKIEELQLTIKTRNDKFGTVRAYIEIQEEFSDLADDADIVSEMVVRLDAVESSNKIIAEREAHLQLVSDGIIDITCANNKLNYAKKEQEIMADEFAQFCPELCPTCEAPITIDKEGNINHDKH